MPTDTLGSRVRCSPLLALLVAGCAGTDAIPLAEATVDTLPGGIIEVMSPGPTAWTDTSGWKLIPDGELEGGVGSPGELINPGDVAIGDDGTVYVADTDPAVIKVYDSTGAFVRTVGREGEGPGEFRVAYLAVRGRSLLVHDPRVARASLFDTSGTFIRSWGTSCCFYGQPAIDVQGRVVVRAMNTPDMHASWVLYRYDTLGTMLDTLLLPEQPAKADNWTIRQGGRNMMSMLVPFSAQSRFCFRSAGGVIHAWSGEYRLVMSESGRDSLQVFGRAWTPEPLADERRDREYEERVRTIGDNMDGMDEIDIRNQLDKGLMPSHLPAFESMNQDPTGAIWIMLDSDSALTRFDVFDSAGVYLGRVDAPGLIPAWQSSWGRDAVYVREEDEAGLPRVARYRIVRP
jgi:hypothetical protein